MAETIKDVLSRSLIGLAEEDDNMVVLKADGVSPWLSGFERVFPDRCFNLGMAELDLVSTAAGMASAGKKPWVFSTASRLVGRAYDALRTAVALPGLPVKVVTFYGGVSAGEDGAVSQILEDLSLMRSLPGMSVWVPCDGLSCGLILKEAYKFDGPAYVRLSATDMPDVYDGQSLQAEATGAVSLRAGDGVTLCACGIMVHEALKAASILAQQDITAEVLDCRSLSPLPERAILDSVHRTGCCVVAEEHSSRGGLGEAVASMLCKNYPVPCRFVSIEGRPGQSGSPRDLLEYYGLTYQQIVGAAVEAWTMRRR